MELFLNNQENDITDLKKLPVSYHLLFPIFKDMNCFYDLMISLFFVVFQNLQNLQNYNYDMTAFGNVPTTLNTGREQTSLAGNVPYSGLYINLTR